MKSIGLGGVGSWVVEALARSGIGKITLFDMDDICVSNINRQIIAQTSTVGKFKAEVLKARILDINPTANVTVHLEFLRPENVLDYLSESISSNDSNITTELAKRKKKFDFVVDAADGVSDKAAILHTCVLSETSIVTSGGVGGLTDPSLITINDLTAVSGDNLLMRVR